MLSLSAPLSSPPLLAFIPFSGNFWRIYRRSSWKVAVKATLTWTWIFCPLLAAPPQALIPMVHPHSQCCDTTSNGSFSLLLPTQSHICHVHTINPLAMACLSTLTRSCAPLDETTQLVANAFLPVSSSPSFTVTHCFRALCS